MFDPALDHGQGIAAKQSAACELVALDRLKEGRGDLARRELRRLEVRLDELDGPRSEGDVFLLPPLFVKQQRRLAVVDLKIRETKAHERGDAS